jgi:hypothetical protein
MADVDGFFQIQVSGHGSQVVGVMIHIVAIAGLSGAPMATAVVGDDSIPVT